MTHHTYALPLRDAELFSGESYGQVLESMVKPLDARPEFGSLSPDAADFIRRCLEWNAVKRPSGETMGSNGSGGLSDGWLFCKCDATSTCKPFPATRCLQRRSCTTTPSSRRTWATRGGSACTQATSPPAACRGSRGCGTAQGGGRLAQPAAGALRGHRSWHRVVSCMTMTAAVPRALSTQLGSSSAVLMPGRRRQPSSGLGGRHSAAGARGASSAPLSSSRGQAAPKTIRSRQSRRR